MGRPFLSQSHSFGGSESWNGEERGKGLVRRRGVEETRGNKISSVVIASLLLGQQQNEYGSYWADGWSGCKELLLLVSGPTSSWKKRRRKEVLKCTVVSPPPPRRTLGQKIKRMFKNLIQVF